MCKVYSLGIDCGLKGCLALLSRDVNNTIEVVSILPMPITPTGSIDAIVIVDYLIEWLSIYGIFSVTIEKQLAFQSKGAAGSYTIGRGVGLLEGICVTLRLPYKIVDSRIWQKSYKAISLPLAIDKLNIKPIKKKSLAVCTQLFPTLEIKTKRGRYKDEVSDSVLIAYWALH